ncbi:DUF4747 family protein [Piscinibacter koreensis]|nr:DUF4747 family protein [Schlegelella koreensis]
MHQPHSAAQYVRVFEAAYRMKRTLRQGSLRAMLLGTLYTSELPDRLTGVIYRFVKIDPNEPWFNSMTQEQATDEELEKIEIPAHLLPHLQQFPFDFRPESHMLYYVAHDRANHMAPAVAVRFLENLLNQAAATAGAPPLEVTAVPEVGALDRMLSIPVLSRLEIELKRPNPDDVGAVARRFLERLEAQNARKMTQELVAEAGQTLTPDRDTAELAVVAATNGKVRVQGRDENNMRFDDSTDSRPLLEPVLLDEELETTFQVLGRAADNKLGQ